MENLYEPGSVVSVQRLSLAAIPHGGATRQGGSPRPEHHLRSPASPISTRARPSPTSRTRYTRAPLPKAHQELDRVVDRCYRAQKFETERERVEFLFGLYEELTPLDLHEIS